MKNLLLTIIIDTGKSYFHIFAKDANDWEVFSDTICVDDKAQL